MFPAGAPAKLLEGAERRRAGLEERGQVGQRFQRCGTEVMFDAFDIGLLGRSVHAQK
jgi:hypothetical protein